MMPHNEFDDVFKSQLTGHESVVPEDMWDRIVQKKDNDKKGLIFFFRIFGIAILALGITGFLLIRFRSKIKIPGKNVALHSSANVATDTSDFRVADLHPAKKAPDSNKKSYIAIESSRPPSAAQFTRGKSRLLWSSSKKTNPEVNSGSHVKNAEVEGALDFKQPSPTETADTIASANRDTANLELIEKAVPAYTKSLSRDSVPDTLSSKKRTEAKEQSRKWAIDFYVSPDYPIIDGSFGKSIFRTLRAFD